MTSRPLIAIATLLLLVGAGCVAATRQAAETRAWKQEKTGIVFTLPADWRMTASDAGGASLLNIMAPGSTDTKPDATVMLVGAENVSFRFSFDVNNARKAEIEQIMGQIHFSPTAKELESAQTIP